MTDPFRSPDLAPRVRELEEENARLRARPSAFAERIVIPALEWIGGALGILLPAAAIICAVGLVIGGPIWFAERRDAGEAPCRFACAEHRGECVEATPLGFICNKPVPGPENDERFTVPRGEP